jgi:hypothetical protein
MSLTRRSILKASLAALPAYYASHVFGQAVSGGSEALDPTRLPPILHGLFPASDVRLLPGSPFYDRQELHRKKTLASYEPDKGNPGDHDPDKASYRHALNGKCLVLAGATDTPGAIFLDASAPGLVSAKLQLNTSGSTHGALRASNLLICRICRRIQT